MAKLGINKIGLIVGVFLAVIHLIWALLVLIIPAFLQSFLDWVFNIHFIKPVWVLTAFNLMDAIFLVVLTFIAGYIIGALFACIFNWLHKK